MSCAPSSARRRPPGPSQRRPSEPSGTDRTLDLVVELGRLERDRTVTVATPATAVDLPETTARELVAVVRACLDNVALHVGEGAPAWVLLQAFPDHVEVSVRDEGPGIADGRLEEAAGQGRLGVSQSIRGRVADLGGTTPSTPGRGAPSGSSSYRTAEAPRGLRPASVCAMAEAPRDPIRVMLVDDHPLWREAVERDLTAAGFDVVATAADGTQALARFAATRPQVVVLDLQIPAPDGVAVTAEVVRQDPATRVLILSASGEHADVLGAVKAGAVGYLVKSASREELLDGVRRVAAGDPVFTAGLAGLVLGEFRRISDEPQRGAEPQLTERETEVLKMVAKGLTYKQIAERLVVSHRTVQNHVQNTLGKLQMHNRVELTRYAIEQGLDEADEPGR